MDIPVDPDATAIYRDAEQALTAKEYERARALAEKASRLSPRLVPARVVFAESSYALGETEAADEGMKKAHQIVESINSNPYLLRYFYSSSEETYDEYFLSAAEKELKGDDKQAANMYRAMISKWPNDVSVLNRLGNLYERDNRLQPALEVFTSASAADKSRAAPILRMALLHGKMGNIDKAEEAFGQFFMVRSTYGQSSLFAQGLIERARLLMELGRIEEARELFVTARATALNLVEPVAEVRSLVYQVALKRQKLKETQRNQGSEETSASLEKEITDLELELDRRVMATGYSYTLQRTILEIGESYFRKRDYSAATEYFHEVTDSIHTANHGLRKIAILSLVKIALLHDDQAEATKALALGLNRKPFYPVPSLDRVLRDLQQLINNKDYSGAIAYIENERPFALDM
jgi:tetratricopeptide (TPR) repeat protein